MFDTYPISIWACPMISLVGPPMSSQVSRGSPACSTAAGSRHLCQPSPAERDAVGSATDRRMKENGPNDGGKGQSQQEYMGRIVMVVVMMMMMMRAILEMRGSP